MPNFGLEEANQKRKIIEHLKKHTWDKNNNWTEELNS
jgi:hypothetical protein